MTVIRQGAEAEEVRQSAKYTFFVEGKDDNTIDPQVLTDLLHPMPIQIKAMGPSSYIRSVAEALHKHHPYYFFLIDRDHHDNDSVEKCWQQFPSENTCNLLIWRRKELENYFLLPEYLEKSQWLTYSKNKLKEKIRLLASERIFLDAANMVIVDCREKMKKNWVTSFKDSDRERFRTKEEALQQLLQKEDFAHKNKDVSNKLHQDFLVGCFEEAINNLFGGQSELIFGYGTWLEMVSGKSLLPTLISTCFRVKDLKGRTLQGNERLMVIVKELLKLPIKEQPDDFRELHRLISIQMRST